MNFKEFAEQTMELWLDDERDPDDPYIQEDFHSARPGLKWVKTAPEAIALLSTGKVKFISLDHDLGLPKMGTGLDVAKWIEEQAFHNKIPRLTWALHSYNPVGVRNMMLALKNADRYWDDHENNVQTKNG